MTIRLVGQVIASLKKLYEFDDGVDCVESLNQAI